MPGAAKQTEAAGMNRKRCWLLALLIMLLVCIWLRCYDRLSWVRFVLALPCPGWLRAWLLGWR